MSQDDAFVGFWHQGALGDFVLFTPVLDAWHEVFPRTAFALWTHGSYRDLLVGKPYPVVVESPQDPLWLSLFTDGACQKSSVPDLLLRCRVFFWVGQKSALPAVESLRTRLGCPVHWVQSFPDGSIREPVTRFLVRQFQALGFSLAEKLPKVFGDTAASEAASWLGAQGLSSGRYGVVHLGSGGLKKVWPIRRWRHFFEETQGFYGSPVVMLSGPADGVLDPFLERFSEKWGWPIFRSADLRALTGVMRRAAFFVGCDSGVSHVAAAMGVPSLVIFGPTDPVVWAPRGKHVKVYQDTWDPGEALHWEAVHGSSMRPDVLQALMEVMKLRPFARRLSVSACSGNVYDDGKPDRGA